MKPEDTIPSITKAAFTCPHCCAYTTQFSHELGAKPILTGSKTPAVPTRQMLDRIKDQMDATVDGQMHNNFEKIYKKFQKFFEGKPVLDFNSGESRNGGKVEYFYISKCFHCSEIAIWVCDRMVFPNRKIDIPPNPDLPDHIQQLFNDARDIVNLSPKGAAALLRLCIQYLCKELGGRGKNLDEDIASFVEKGLNPVVQQSLDVVRVIGNEAVHPGEIDLNDNKDIALSLFGLINSICEQMLSHPKRIEELYQGLPPKKLEAIEKRDQKAKGQEAGN